LPGGAVLISVGSESIREKCHRFPLEYYRGEIAISFTLCIKDRVSAFTRAKVVHPLIDILASSAGRESCLVPGFCYMPEHQHLILLGTEPHSNIWKALCEYKQKSGFWLSRNSPGSRWQKDFHDHIMRERDDLAGHVRYILENPVRKELVSNWQDYPFSGSLWCKLDEVLAGLFN
jgi:REP element-mobilizing transposase RayT